MKQIMLMMLISISTQAQKQNAPIYTSDMAKVQRYADSINCFKTYIRAIHKLIEFAKDRPSNSQYLMYVASFPLWENESVSCCTGIACTEYQYIGRTKVEMQGGIPTVHDKVVGYPKKPLQPYIYKRKTTIINSAKKKSADSLNIEYWHEPINGNPIRTAAYKVFKP